jgi:hypothetical protein
LAGPLFCDRVLETTTTTGTGTLTLAGAVTGYQSFACVGDGNTCYYALFAVDGSGVPTGVWECGLGTYTASGTTLARTTVYSNSSGTTAALSLSSGTKRVLLTPIAKFFAGSFGDGSDGAVTISADTTWANSTATNDTGYVVKQFSSLTIDAAKTVTATQRSRVMVVYVQGNCTINGTLHMDKQGAAATPTTASAVTYFLANFFGARSQTTFSIPLAGAAGGAAQTGSVVAGNAGAAGTGGQTGGGGGGAHDDGAGQGGAGASGGEGRDVPPYRHCGRLLPHPDAATAQASRSSEAGQGRVAYGLQGDATRRR